MRGMIVLGSIAGAVAAMLAGVPAAKAPAEPPGGIAGGCTPSTGPDLIVGDLGDFDGIFSFGTLNGISAYAMSTDSCNIGSQTILWQHDTSNHPVIAQQIYRLKSGRFEQIGLSWLKHGWASDTASLCCTCQDPGKSQLMGIGCSDAYDAGQNGGAAGFPCFGGSICSGLGPRYQLNATTGVFPYPYATIGQSGDTLYKRLQV